MSANIPSLVAHKVGDEAKRLIDIASGPGLTPLLTRSNIKNRSRSLSKRSVGSL